MSERTSDTKNFEVITATPERLAVNPGGEAIALGRGRRRNGSSRKRFCGGENVSVIARPHGLDPAQLFAWRRKALASGLVAPVSGARGQAVKFVRFDAVTSTLWKS
ncbi:transposase [Bradyrhizobium erythrophlei]|uniref:transposase n=1 Tax=Bradyrhizobium erythrophlei TaxID=1437360 RepID=UPI0035ED7608